MNKYFYPKKRFIIDLVRKVKNKMSSTLFNRGFCILDILFHVSCAV